MKSTFQATRYFIKRRARMSVLETLIRYWRFWNSELIPESYLIEIIPSLAGLKLEVSADVRHAFELPYGERLVLTGFMQHLQPRHVFEFGTYSGSTTTLLADCLPEGGQVITLDLPDEELVAAGIDSKDIGSCFAGDSRYTNKIVLLRGNSRTFDFSRFERKMNLVFVDGSHRYEDVLSDSRNAMNMLAPGGMILWDDYHPPCLPVAEALDDLAPEMRLRRIAQTRLVVYGPHGV